MRRAAVEWLFSCSIRCSPPAPLAAAHIDRAAGAGEHAKIVLDNEMGETPPLARWQPPWQPDSGGGGGGGGGARLTVRVAPTR